MSDSSVVLIALAVLNLLVLAALDEARPAPDARPVDVAELCRQSLAAFSLRALAAGVELDLDSPDSLAWPLPASAWQSMLDNLLDNALRYGPRQGGRVQVTLARQDDGTLCLSVRDDGPGIAQAEQAHIFERFVRGRGQQAGGAGGAGLGLAIVRQAARSLGGEVRLGPGLAGRGVGFEVRLPGPQRRA